MAFDQRLFTDLTYLQFFVQTALTLKDVDSLLEILAYLDNKQFVRVAERALAKLGFPPSRPSNAAAKRPRGRPRGRMTAEAANRMRARRAATIAARA